MHLKKGYDIGVSTETVEALCSTVECYDNEEKKIHVALPDTWEMKGRIRPGIAISVPVSVLIMCLLYTSNRDLELESAGLKSPLIEKVPTGNPTPCDFDHFPCDPSSIYPDPQPSEIAWNHKYDKAMTIPRGLGYYHINKKLTRGAHDPRIWGQLGPTKNDIEKYADGNSIPRGLGYYPEETISTQNAITPTMQSPDRGSDDFIPLSIGYYKSEIPERVLDTDGFDPSQSYMRDPSFYGDSFRSAYPFDPESRPKFYPAAT